MPENSKRRLWKIGFLRTSTAKKKITPREFICPISGSLMHDPVVVPPTGLTFDRISAKVCKDYSFAWTLDNGTKVDDFDLVIPNLTMKSTIQNWCRVSKVHSSAPDYASVEKIVKERMISEGINSSSCVSNAVTDCGLGESDRELIEGVGEKQSVFRSHAETEIGVRRSHRSCSVSSEESVVVVPSPPSTPLPLKVKPSCYSSGSSLSEIDTVGQGEEQDAVEEEIVRKLRSGEIYEQEEGVVMLRKVTRVMEESRVGLCSSRVLSGLRELMASRYTGVQMNAVAALVNLSLEKCNKLKIVRAGVVPVVIDVLKGGGAETQEHAAGVLFSLALEDANKMAIGVLGALPPLMFALRSESERTRNDSALALYHLSLVKSNQIKLVKLGAVSTLLGMVRTGLRGFVSRVLLVLCNLAICDEGRSVMLDGNAVECFVGMLRRGEFDTEATRENCVAALYALSHGSWRFNGLAKEAGAVMVLKEIEEKGTDRARKKAGSILQVMKGRDKGDEGEDIDWDGILESSEFSRTWSRVVGTVNANATNTSDF